MRYIKSSTKENSMAENYTVEQTQELVAQYQAGLSVDELAKVLDKPVRSVRSKLVREGVYIAQPRGKVAKVEGPSKKELLRELETHGIVVDGLEGATKEAIARIIAIVAN
jgi:hypothetical protein